MNESPYCGNTDALTSYLYEEGPAAERLAFEAHLRQCERCAAEAASLRAVRVDMAAWTPPETVLDFRIVREPAQSASRWGWMSTMPAWAQLAAASLVVGVAAGLSGLDVQYGSDGLIVRTGWSRPAGRRTRRAAAAGDDAPWRTELAALREQIQTELSQNASAPTVVPASAGAAGGSETMGDDAFLARVKQLIEASEARTQREMALRLTEMVREMDTQRRADMRRVADGLGVLEGRTGAVTAQQREVMNYLMKVSQRQQ